MSAPAVTETTAAIYAELPEAFRTLDDDPNDWPLLRYIAVLGDQVDDVVAQLRLLQAGAMADPVNAPSGWLDFMAQFVALNTTGLTVPEKRFSIASGASLLAGSLASLKAAVEALLGGEKRYIIATHDGGDPFAIRVFVNSADAGGTTWDSLALDNPSWSAWEAAASWDDLEMVAPIEGRNVLAAVTPAWIVLNVEALADGPMWFLLELDVTSWDQWEAQFATWDDLENGSFAWP